MIRDENVTMKKAHKAINPMGCCGDESSLGLGDYVPLSVYTKDASRAVSSSPPLVAYQELRAKRPLGLFP